MTYTLISSSHEHRQALYEHVRICEQGLASSSCACNPSVSHFFLCHGTRQELIKALHLGKIRWDGRQPKRESTTAFHMSDSSCCYGTGVSSSCDSCVYVL